MTSITYADLCIERAEKATEEPWVGDLLGIYSKLRDRRIAFRFWAEQFGSEPNSQ